MHLVLGNLYVIISLHCIECLDELLNDFTFTINDRITHLWTDISCEHDIAIQKSQTDWNVKSKIYENKQISYKSDHTYEVDVSLGYFVEFCKFIVCRVEEQTKNYHFQRFFGFISAVCLISKKLNISSTNSQKIKYSVINGMYICPKAFLATVISNYFNSQFWLKIL